MVKYLILAILVYSHYSYSLFQPHDQKVYEAFSELVQDDLVSKEYAASFDGNDFSKYKALLVARMGDHDHQIWRDLIDLKLAIASYYESDYEGASRKLKVIIENNTLRPQQLFTAMLTLSFIYLIDGHNSESEMLLKKLLELHHVSVFSYHETMLLNVSKTLFVRSFDGDDTDALILLSDLDKKCSKTMGYPRGMSKKSEMSRVFGSVTINQKGKISSFSSLRVYGSEQGLHAVRKYLSSCTFDIKNVDFKNRTFPLIPRLIYMR